MKETVLMVLMIGAGIWLAASLLLFATCMLAVRIIRREMPWNILLMIALVSTLFLLIPCIGYFLFPLALLYLLVYVAGLELWPPALLVALISTVTSVLVWQLLRLIIEKTMA